MGQMADKRSVDELTVEELERILLIKRREERIERLRRLAAEGRLAEEPALLVHQAEEDVPALLDVPAVVERPPRVTSGFRPVQRSLSEIADDRARQRKQHLDWGRLWNNTLLFLEVLALSRRRRRV